MSPVGNDDLLPIGEEAQAQGTKEGDIAMNKLIAILILAGFAGTTLAAAPSTDSAKPAKAAKTTDSAKAAK
jgi:hypothetical protein